jgi:hypothetical protein
MALTPALLKSHPRACAPLPHRRERDGCEPRVRPEHPTPDPRGPHPMTRAVRGQHTTKERPHGS